MRSFVAVEITEQEIIDKIRNIQDELKIKAKPVNSKNMHFTLQFLGDITESTSKNIQKALQTVSFEPFELLLKGIGVFPKPELPRVVWIGTDEKGGKNLKDLAHMVNDVLSPLGFQSDKPFKPHLTIFRIKSKIGDITKDLERFRGIELGPQQITQFKLKKSILTSKGPTYSDLLEVNST